VARAFARAIIVTRRRREMRSILALAAVAVTMTLAAVTPALSQAGNHLIISNLKVPGRTQLEAGIPYEASIDIRTPGTSVELGQLCFFWNAEGPFCFRRYDMRKGSDGAVHPTIGLKTGNPGTYKLTAVMTYRVDGRTYETNQISTNITVR
jgi:hypothetical protein